MPYWRRICPKCEKLFATRFPEQVFCSRRCREDSRDFCVTCRYCGDMFWGSYHRSTCDKCADENQRAYIKGWRARNPNYQREWYKANPDYYKNRAERQTPEFRARKSKYNRAYRNLRKRQDAEMARKQEDRARLMAGLSSKRKSFQADISLAEGPEGIEKGIKKWLDDLASR